MATGRAPTAAAETRNYRRRAGLTVKPHTAAPRRGAPPPVPSYGDGHAQSAARAPSTCSPRTPSASCRPTAATRSRSPAVPTPASRARSTRCASRTRWPACPRRPGAPSNWCSSISRPTTDRYPGRPAGLRLRQGAAGPAGALAGVPRRLLRQPRGAARAGGGDGHPPSAEGLRPADAGLRRRARPARACVADQGRQARRGAQRQRACSRCARSCRRAFGDTVSVQAFSGESKQGVDEARAVVRGWLGSDAAGGVLAWAAAQRRQSIYCAPCAEDSPTSSELPPASGSDVRVRAPSPKPRSPSARAAGRVPRCRRAARRRVAHRHRAREVRLPPRRPAPADLRGRARHRSAARRADALRLGAGRGTRPRHRADRATARRSRSSRPASSSCPARQLETIHETCCEVDAHLREVKTVADELRPRLPRHGLPAEVAPRRDAVDAQGPLQDHARLHAQGRHARPGHDDAHLHGAGQPRLRQRSGHGEEVPRRRSRCSRSRPRCSPIRRSPKASRTAICQLSLAHLDRHRSGPHRHARLRVRGRLRLRALRRLPARRADVFRLPRRQVHRPVRASRSASSWTANCRASARRAADADATGPTT